MLRLPADHPQRFALAEEVHARPSESVETPSQASYIAVLADNEHREREHVHIAALCERYGVSPPKQGVTHLSAAMGAFRLKWERHGEFSSFTFFSNQANHKSFEHPVLQLLPENWLTDLPGKTVVAAHVLVLPNKDHVPDIDTVARYFSGNTVVGAQVGDGAGYVFTDFRIHHDGCTRFVLLDHSLTSAEAGRTLQRLFEIEAYRMMALLAFPIARRQAPRVLAIERALAELTDDIARDSGKDEELLKELTRLAAEIESGLSASQYRFGASRAYYELVNARISELREKRISSMQTIDEFMARRLKPAVATCATVSQRMRDLSERVAQASGLLATRVSIAREQQNQALLASMNRRAQMQFRLQQTVEGLSVAAILYYLVGLAGYGAKGLSAAGLAVKPDVLTALSIPVVGVIVLIGVRRARRHVFSDEPQE